MLANAAPYRNLKQIGWNEYPDSQKLKCENLDKYIFVRERLGNNIVTKSNHPFGTYLYRNIRNDVLIASFEKPSSGEEIYSASDIGMFSDALIYYKNE